MSDIMERLKKMGVTKGISASHEIRPKKSFDPFATLQKTFSHGIIGENDIGPFFLNRTKQPLTEFHGKVDMSIPLTPSPIFDAIMGLPNIKTKSVLAMDTETSGLSQASASFVFMIGMGYVSEDQYVVDQLILPDICYEKAFLRQIELTFEKFSALITYNGKAFDVPMIQGRSRYHLQPDFCRNIHHIDLLQIARRYWKQRLGSVRLSNIERYVLHLERSEEETPGSLAPELYRKYLTEFDADCISGIAYHNRIDVISLYAFTRLLNDLCSSSGEDPEIWERNGASLSQLLKHHESLFPECVIKKHKNFSRRDKKEIASSSVNRKDYARAAELYTELAESGDAECAIKAAELFTKLKEHDRAEHFRLLALKLIENDPSIGIWTKKRYEELLRGKKKQGN